MKAWIFQPVTYVPSSPLPQIWPLPPAHYDREIGERAYHNAIEQAVIAEQLGFDGVSVSEHHYAAASMAPTPAVMAAALSQRLQRATIALLGAVIPLTNPVRIAEEYAMLDNLTGGRLVAGMLRGTPNEFLTYGTNPDESRSQYEEGVELILKAWTEPQPFGWQGRHYQYRTISVWPGSVQKPHPPVFLSGNSQESGSFAARKHVSIGLSFVPVSVAARLSTSYREQAAQAGWEPSSDNILYRGFIHVAETDQKAREEVAATYFQTRTGPVHPPSHSETDKAPAPDGFDTKKALSAEQFQTLGLQFCGSPETVFKQIKRLKDEAGIGIIDFFFQGPSLPHGMLLHSMELFGKEVLPRMQEL